MTPTPAVSPTSSIPALFHTPPSRMRTLRTSKIPAKPCTSNHTAAALHSCAARPEFGHERTTQASFPPPPRPDPAPRIPPLKLAPYKSLQGPNALQERARLSHAHSTPALPTPSTTPTRGTRKRTAQFTDLPSARYAQAPGRLNHKILELASARAVELGIT
ncbi:hypothetical protein R3P38DRAFT_3172138 [Favolaschia claudopus]|uniref:Uncharacterized protein n=1 Tax=Favolaschia claudopus TaxID=2862362 RepID=A0AAW0DJ03_9AGAR